MKVLILFSCLFLFSTIYGQEFEKLSSTKLLLMAKLDSIQNNCFDSLINNCDSIIDLLKSQIAEIEKKRNASLIPKENMVKKYDNSYMVKKNEGPYNYGIQGAGKSLQAAGESMGWAIGIGLLGSIIGVAAENPYIPIGTTVISFFVNIYAIYKIHEAGKYLEETTGLGNQK